MPLVSDLIMRAAFMDRLSAASRNRGRFDVAAILQDLDSSMKLMDVANKYGFFGKEHSAEAEHLRRYEY